MAAMAAGGGALRGVPVGDAPTPGVPLAGGIVVVVVVLVPETGSLVLGGTTTFLLGDGVGLVPAAAAVFAAFMAAMAAAGGALRGDVLGAADMLVGLVFEALVEGGLEGRSTDFRTGDGDNSTVLATAADGGSAAEGATFSIASVAFGDGLPKLLVPVLEIGVVFLGDDAALTPGGLLLGRLDGDPGALIDVALFRAAITGFTTCGGSSGIGLPSSAGSGPYLSLNFWNIKSYSPSKELSTKSMLANFSGA